KASVERPTTMVMTVRSEDPDCASRGPRPLATPRWLHTIVQSAVGPSAQTSLAKYVVALEKAVDERALFAPPGGKFFSRSRRFRPTGAARSLCHCSRFTGESHPRCSIRRPSVRFVERRPEPTRNRKSPPGGERHEQDYSSCRTARS